MTALGSTASRTPRALGAGRSARALALLGSAAVGVLLAVQPTLGLAALLALCYVPLVLSDLSAGVAIWIVLTFLQGISAANIGGKAAGVLVGATWLGLLVHRRAAVAALVRRNRSAFVALVGLTCWVTLSLFWAVNPIATLADLWHWYAVALIFLVIATSLDSRRSLRLAVLAFAAGACISVAYGLAGGTSGPAPVGPQVPGSSRLVGGIGDPNFLAAGIVPALVFLVILAGGWREFSARTRALAAFALPPAGAILIAGLVATESRGGLLALLVVVALAIPLFPGQRRWVTAAILILGVAAALAVVASPSALQRVSSPGNGSGRTDEWTVAWRIIRGHPIAGVGDANYVVVAKDYTREPGVLTDANLLVDQPHVTHNTYLQLLSETGVIGLALFAAVAAACLRAGWSAARCFRAAGDKAMELLSRGVVAGLIAMLTAAVFISAGADQGLWTLFAFCPALLAVAEREARGASSRRTAPVRRYGSFTEIRSGVAAHQGHRRRIHA